MRFFTEEQLYFYQSISVITWSFFSPTVWIDNLWQPHFRRYSFTSVTADGRAMFTDTCEHVLTIFENCTHDGLLSLPIAVQVDKPNCTTTDFFNSKAVAILIISKPITFNRAKSPCEYHFGIRFFQNNNIALISHSGWRATVSYSDIYYERGCKKRRLSHSVREGFHSISASPMRVYILIERFNMQYLRNSDQSPCMSPRLYLTWRQSMWKE